MVQGLMRCSLKHIAKHHEREDQKSNNETNVMVPRPRNTKIRGAF